MIEKLQNTECFYSLVCSNAAIKHLRQDAEWIRDLLNGCLKANIHGAAQTVPRASLWPSYKMYITQGLFCKVRIFWQDKPRRLGDIFIFLSSFICKWRLSANVLPDEDFLPNGTQIWTKVILKLKRKFSQNTHSSWTIRFPSIDPGEASILEFWYRSRTLSLKPGDTAKQNQKTVSVPPERTKKAKQPLIHSFSPLRCLWRGKIIKRDICSMPRVTNCPSDQNHPDYVIAGLPDNGNKRA
ncbi:hypothetical protein CDAR_521311 [Caerostris darwini]|uniref:Uncharacterized protein n=1 Tax=Caerostris darwini TaxID=1538125 RepID=A0AAV4VAA5_9ARAC|nr:hypothetical protein CDAR_521311 [Caerostris darwini]